MIIYLQLSLPYFGKILHSAYIAKPFNLKYFDLEKKQVDVERFSNRSNTKFVKHRITSLIFRTNLISDACICDRRFFRSLPTIHG